MEEEADSEERTLLLETKAATRRPPLEIPEGDGPRDVRGPP
jgi:hypothetical protein